MVIDNDLAVFGLNDQEQHVYLSLPKLGWITVVQLSKICPLKRTTVYRVLDALVQKGLVVMQTGDKTTFYSISSSDSFKSLIYEEEAKANQMRKAAETIKEYTEKLAAINPTETSVLYYKGIRGLKQMEWIIRGRQPNIEVLAFDSLQWSDRLGSDFAEELRQQNVEKNVRIRGISNAEDPIAPNGTTSWTTNKKYTLKHYRHRLIDRKILDIMQDIFIMPDSIVWGVKTGDEVAIQITNTGIPP